MKSVVLGDFGYLKQQKWRYSMKGASLLMIFGALYLAGTFFLPNYRFQWTVLGIIGILPAAGQFSRALALMAYRHQAKDKAVEVLKKEGRLLLNELVIYHHQRGLVIESLFLAEGTLFVWGQPGKQSIEVLEAGIKSFVTDKGFGDIDIKVTQEYPIFDQWLSNHEHKEGQHDLRDRIKEHCLT